MMRCERGTTLLVVLVMLVVITLFGIASIRMSSSSLLVVGNMQARKLVENWAEQGIEQTLSSIEPFNAPTSAVTITKPDGTVPLPAGIAVTVGTRTCVASTPAAGYSAVFALAPEDNVWEFEVAATDSLTGARARMVQGARIRQLAGSCT